MSILQISLYGSAIAAAVLILRALALYRIPRRTFPVLWGVAILRFLMPIDVASPISIYSVFQSDTGPIPAYTVVLPEAAGHAPSAAQIAENTAPLSTFNWWPVIWTAGAIIVGAVFTASYVVCLRRFAVARPVTDASVDAWLTEHPLRRRVAVKQSDAISSPLTYGLLRPVILFPAATDWKDTQNVQLVLAHEHAHIRRWDTLYKLLLAGTVCLHWFNPLVWVLYVFANRDLELACDETVADIQTDRADYARMLLDAEEQRCPAVSCSWAGSALEERIHSIMITNRHKLLGAVLAVLLILTVAASCAMAPADVPRLEATGDMSEQSSYTSTGSVAAETESGGEHISGTTNAAEGDTGYAITETSIATPEEYEVWAAGQKEALQSMLGREGWSSSEGRFTWTQERIDAAIAQYDEVLKILREGGSMAATARELSTPGIPVSFVEYEPFGLTNDGNALMYNGARVALFVDSVELDPGCYATRNVRYDPEGTVHVKTVRNATQNSDGSTDPFGQIVGLEYMTPAEAALRIREYAVTAEGAETENPESAESTPNDAERAGKAPQAAHESYEADNREVTVVTVSDYAGALQASHGDVGTTFEELFSRYSELGLRFEKVGTPERSGYNLFVDGVPINHFADASSYGTFTFDSLDQAPGGQTAVVQYENGRAVRLVVS